MLWSRHSLDLVVAGQQHVVRFTKAYSRQQTGEKCYIFRLIFKRWLFYVDCFMSTSSTNWCRHRASKWWFDLFLRRLAVASHILDHSVGLVQKIVAWSWSLFTWVRYSSAIQQWRNKCPKINTQNLGAKSKTKSASFGLGKCPKPNERNKFATIPTQLKTGTISWVGCTHTK
jgi:hypothetical protein